MNRIQRLGTVIRSKIPVFQSSNDRNEETLLLGSFGKNYSSSAQSEFNAEDVFVENRHAPLSSTSYQNAKQVDGFENDENFKLERDLTDNDLHSLNEKSYSNRIDEWQAAWNVTNAIQGMFVVSLPYAVANGGYWALLAMLLVAYVCCYTGKILVDCLYDDDDDQTVDFFANKHIPSIQICKSRRRHRIRTSYVDIAKDVWGSRFGARIVNVAQNIELLMTCILYLVLCGDLFVGSFPNSPLDHSAWTMISCMILIPCAFIKSLRFVSRLSFCNAIVHLIINIIIVFYCLTRFSDWNFRKVEYRIDIWTFPISLGIIVFSYTSQIFLPTLEGSMIDRTKFDSMLNLSHLAAAIFKAAFGYIGFLTWQDNTKEEITNNLPTIELKILVNMILVVKALLSYPLPYFASVELLESTLFASSEHQIRSEEFQTEQRSSRTKSTVSSSSARPLFTMTCYDPDGDLKFWAVCLRIGLIIFTLFLAIFIPHFAILMGLIGSITGTMLSLIWPCYFHLHLKRKTLKWHQKVLDVTIIVFGVLISIIGIYIASVRLFEALIHNSKKLDKSYYKDNNFFTNRNMDFANASLEFTASKILSNLTLIRPCSLLPFKRQC